MNPKPIAISTARQIAGQHGLHTLVCIYEMPDGTLGYTSYGRDRRLSYGNPPAPLPRSSAPSSVLPAAP